jgi:T-complex protein 1 subunit theta
MRHLNSVTPFGAVLDSCLDLQALFILQSLILPGSENIDLRDVKAVAERLQCPLSAKQYGYEQMLAPLIAEACISVCPKNPLNFNVDNVRTVKMPGALASFTAV